MTKEQHYEIYKEHSDNASKHLQAAIEGAENHDHKVRDYEYNQYKQEIKIARKHYGIASAMGTKEINKLAGYKVC